MADAEPPDGGDVVDPPPDDDVPDPVRGLKDTSTDADRGDVLEGLGGRPRVTWNSVTDTGGVPSHVETDPEDRSSFQFDLGGALARLGGENGDEPPPPPAARQQPAVAPPDVAVPAESFPSREPEPAPQPSPPPPPPPEVVPPVAAPLPSRSPEPVAEQPSAPVAEPDYPRRVPGTHLESEMRADAPLPPIHEATPITESARIPQRQSVFEDAARESALRSSGAPSGTSPAGAAAGSMPTLPASNPAAPPPVVEAIDNAPSTPDINALRSAQLRASKQQRQGKLFGRSLLAFVLIGGLLGAALVFGRSLLFNTEWDAQLTPIVNEVEAERGVEFDHTVPLAVVPTAEFGDRIRAMTIGDQWVERVPEWRALGLATGDITAENIGAAMAASTTAIYDPDGDVIYQVEGVDPAVATSDLRVALERAFDRQLGAGPTPLDDAEADAATSGFTGVSSPRIIATRAVDEVLAVGGSTAERQPADETLPIPISYELAAIDVLGEPILAAAGVDAALLKIGSSYPDSIGDVLDDSPVATTSGLLSPGDTSLAEPAALGMDDWSLVWGTRLPQPTVDRLVDQVSADSYRPIDRGGNVCVIGVFDTRNDVDGSAVFAAMLTWAANSPAAAQATATALSTTRVEIRACDPGIDGGTARNPGAVDALIDRQQLRLTN